MGASVKPSGVNLRPWVAWYLQRRRRKRVAEDASPGALPTVVLSNQNYDSNDSGGWDVSFDVAVDRGAWPVGTLEIYRRFDVAESLLIDTVSGDIAHYVNASDEPGDIFYKARYVNGSDVGTFSAEVQVEID
jgi:hypothetical protein